MSQKVREFLRKQIASTGPMDVGTFMGHVLGHPEHGYYIRQDPLGKMGDFITSPEVSQMFGELIGAWAADTWMQMGSPKAFILLEGGPGRGTLMADALRATRKVPGFHEALDLHFLETSPTLRKVQAQAIEKAFKPTWHDSLETLPDDRPIIMIANELLDALPFRQIEMTDKGWVERVVTVAQQPALKQEGFRQILESTFPNLFGQGEENNGFVFAHKAFPAVLVKALPDICKQARPGDIYEFAPAREGLVKAVCSRLKTQGGAALFIDYGATEPVLNDSFRAVHNHTHVPVLSKIGSADLTSDVDFVSVETAAKSVGVSVHGPCTQEDFLKGLGITQRAEALSAKADEKQQDDIKKALHRLIDSGEMGSHFKVIGLSNVTNYSAPGF